jgi:CubicO group peptidase (beta-lactamase class C family)
VALGVALARAIGEPLAAYAARRLFEPLGIERAEWPLTPLGDASTAGGLLLTSRDLLELGQLYLAAGRWDGRPVVSAGWVEESTKPHVAIDADTEYGYLWWLKSYSGEPSFFMSGTGGNRVHVFPRRQLVAVVTSANFRVRGAHELSDRLVTELLGTWSSAQL